MCTNFDESLPTGTEKKQAHSTQKKYGFFFSLFSREIIGTAPVSVVCMRLMVYWPPSSSSFQRSLPSSPTSGRLIFPTYEKEEEEEDAEETMLSSQAQFHKVSWQ